MLDFIKKTVLGGVVFMVPVVALILIVGKALQLSAILAVPVASALGFDTIAGVAAAELLAIGFLILICFLAGLAAQTARARAWVRSLEDNVLDRIPAYQLLKTKAQSTLDFESSQDLQPIKVRFDDAWQLAFEMERIEGGEVVVFQPGAPDPWSGSVCIVSADRVTKLDMTVNMAVSLLKRLGRGSAEVLSAGELGKAAQ